jgi:hypothetical protein
LVRENAAADYKGYRNNAMREALDDFASAYLDHILIWSNSKEEHVGHVKWIMQRLLEAGLYLEREKCEFHIEAVRYLGLIISTKGISMDKDKMETVRNRSREKMTEKGQMNNLVELQQFLGFNNDYRRFIPKYSEKAESLMSLRKKDTPFVSEAEQQLVFEMVVPAFATGSALQHFEC